MFIVQSQEYTLKEDYSVTQDGTRAVPCGHPEGYFLLGRRGTTISIKDAIRFGFLNADGTEPAAQEEKAPKTKGVKASDVSNKAIQPEANK